MGQSVLSQQAQKEEKLTKRKSLGYPSHTPIPQKRKGIGLNPETSKLSIGRRWKMKLTWKNNRKRPLLAVSQFSNLPFENRQDDNVRQHQQEANNGADNDEDSIVKNQNPNQSQTQADRELSEARQLSKEFQAQGDKLAEDGNYREALGKWETAITLTPEVAVLHEQKAQVLLEIGDAWNALKAATRATELEPSWAEGWLTLGRAQLNFGEPDSAIESFDRALAIKPDCEEARGDRETALRLVKRRKQLHSSGVSITRNRFVVADKEENS